MRPPLGNSNFSHPSLHGPHQLRKNVAGELHALTKILSSVVRGTRWRRQSAAGRQGDVMKAMIYSCPPAADGDGRREADASRRICKKCGERMLLAFHDLSQFMMAMKGGIAESEVT